MNIKSNLQSLVAIQLPAVCNLTIQGGIDKFGSLDWSNVVSKIMPVLAEAMEVGERDLNSLHDAVLAKWKEYRAEYLKEKAKELTQELAGVR